MLLVEALPRLGGRAHTSRSPACRSISAAAGCIRPSATRSPRWPTPPGVEIDRSKAAWGKQLRDVGAPAGTQEQAWDAYEAFGTRLRRDPPASDRAGDAMSPGDPWRPFVDALSGFMNGAEIDQLSVADFLAYDDAASGTNWRLPGGYGAFIASLGAGLPAALGTRVTAVSAGRRIRLDTDRGPIEARAAIVAVSTAVLASGAIRFDPPADEHLHAASRLPLGLADKIFLSLAEPDAVPPESHLLGRFDSARTGSYYLRPFGRPVVECFLGGVLARELEAAGEDAAVAFVTDELRAPARRRLRPRPRAARGHCLGPGADDPRLLQPRPPRIGRRPRRSGPTGEPSPLLRRRGLLAAGLLDRPRCLGDRHRGGGPDRGRPLSGAASWRNLRRRLPRNPLSVRPMP